MRVADLLPADFDQRYPRGTLTKKGERLLELELPANASEELQKAVATETMKALPRFTTAARAIGRTRSEAGAREAAIEQEYAPGSPEAATRRREQFGKIPAAGRIAMQAATAAAEFLPIPGAQTTGREVPAPEGIGERMGRLGGSVAGFATAAAPATTALRGLGVGARVAGALGAGAAAAVPQGTPGERAVRAGVTAATAGASGLVGEVAASRVASPAGKMLTHAVTGGAAFGAVQPQIEARVLGQKPPGAEEGIRSGLEMAALNVLLGGRALVPGGRGSSAEVTGSTPGAPRASEAPATELPGVAAKSAMLGLPGARPAAPDPQITAAYNEIPEMPASPVLGGRTPRQAFLQLVQERSGSVEDIPAAIDWARRSVNLSLRLQQHILPPPVPPGKEALAGSSPRLTSDLQRTLGAIQGDIAVDVPGVGRIENAAFMQPLTRVYPWDPRPVRVVVVDRETQQVYPASFASVDQLSQSIARPAGPTVTPEARARVSALEREVAAGGPKAEQQARRLARVKEETGIAAEERGAASVQDRQRALASLERQIRERPNDKNVKAWRRRAADIRAELIGRAPAVVQPTPALEPKKEVPGPSTTSLGVSSKEESTSAGPPAQPIREPAVPSEPAPTPAIASRALSPRAPTPTDRVILPNMAFRDEAAAQRVADGIREAQPWSEPKVVQTRKGFEIEAAPTPPPSTAARTAQAKAEVRPPVSVGGREQKEGPSAALPEAPVPADRKQIEGKFKPKESVLVPYEGRSKKRTVDRGEVVGYVEHDGKRLVHVSVRKGEKYKGTYVQRYVEERQVRRRPKPDRRPLHEKAPGTYRKMTLAALGEPDVAAEQLRTAHAATMEALNAERGPLGSASYKRAQANWRAAGIREAIAEQVLYETEHGPSESSGLREIAATVRASGLGRQAREYLADRVEAGTLETVGQINDAIKTLRPLEKMDADVRGRLFQRAVQENWGSARLRGEVTQWSGFVTAAKREGIEESKVYTLAHEFAGAVGALTDRISAHEARAARERDIFAEADPGTVARHGKAAERELAAVRALTASAQREALDALKGGKSFNDALYELRKKIEKQIEPNVADWRDPDAKAPVSLGAFPGNVGQWLYDLALRGIKRAQERQRREAGRLGSTAKVVDARGNAIFSERLIHEPDPWTEHAAYRVLARARLLGGNYVYTPELQREADVAVSSYPWMEGHMRQMAHDVLGPDFARDFRPGSANSRELFKAVQGESHSLPAKYHPLIQRWRDLFDDFYSLVKAEAERRGEDPPGYVRDYAPRLTIGKKPDSVLRLVRALVGENASEMDVAEKANRFLEHRTGDPRYERDAAWALEAYIGSTSRWYAFNPFFAKAADYLKTGLLTEPGRAGIIRDNIISNFFRSKSRWEEMVDRGMRAAIFRKTRGFINDIPPDVAKELTGIEPAEGMRYVYADPATEVSAPPGWSEVGRAPDGGAIWAGKEGMPRPAGAPELRGPFEKIARTINDMRLKRMKEYGVPDSHARERLVLERELVRVERDPVSYITGLMSRNALRAFMGWNVKAMTQNALNNVLTGIPEHGLMATLQAYAQYGPAAAAKTMRAQIDFLERSGHLSKDEAAAARAALPYHRGEYLPAALGAQQGEVQRASEMHLEDPTVARMIRNAAAPLKGYQLVEDFTRGVDAISAITAGERLGLEPAAVAEFIAADAKAREQAWKRVTERLRDPGSAESYAARTAGRTMFHYDFRGRGALFTGPFGQMIGLLSTFPVNFTLNYYVRPMAGLGSVAAAAGRRMLGQTPGPRPVHMLGEHFKERGTYPAAKNPIAQWLEQGGAGFEARSAARVAAYQILMTGALIGLNEMLPFTASVTGLAGWALGVYGLVAMAMQDIPALRPAARSLGRAVEGGKRNVAEAYTGRNPALSLFWNSGDKLAQETARASKEAGQVRGFARKSEKMAQGVVRGLDPTLIEFIRVQTIKGLIELRRIVQQNPGFIDKHAPWVYDLLGIRSKYRLKGVAQNVRFQTGTMKEEERKRAYQPVHPRGKPYIPQPVGAKP